MIGLAFPLVLIIFCIALPLAVCLFGVSFGAPQTCIDDENIFPQNFLFMPKKIDGK